MNHGLPPRLNTQFRFLYYPEPGLDLKNRRCFLIGAYQLPNYIGRHNAEKAIKRALKSDKDKISVKLPSYGRVDIYVK